MIEIPVNSSTITRKLGVVAFLLVLASIVGQLERFLLDHDYLNSLVALFYLDNEQNIPTYYTMLLMIFAALLLAAIAVLNGKQREPYVSKWAILSIGFLSMAFDEIFQVHERLSILIRNLLGDGNLGIFFFSWVIPGLVLVLILGLFFLRFLLFLPMTTRRNFLLAGTIYIGGAIGLELVGGWYAESHGKENMTYSMIATIEESFEMVGLILFIRELLKYFEDKYKEVRCRFVDSSLL